MPKGPNIAETLRMSHLETEDTDDLVRALDSKMGQESLDATSDPRDEEEWSFHFDWQDSRGKRWVGDFVNKILSIGDQQKVAVFKSQLCGGQPLESMDSSILLVNAAVAHMSLSLIERPDWAKDLRKMKDVALILELFKKVDSHEARFFRLGETQKEGG